MSRSVVMFFNLRGKERKGAFHRMRGRRQEWGRAGGKQRPYLGLVHSRQYLLALRLAKILARAFNKILILMERSRKEG